MSCFTYSLSLSLLLLWPFTKSHPENIKKKKKEKENRSISWQKKGPSLKMQGTQQVGGKQTHHSDIPAITPYPQCLCSLWCFSITTRYSKGHVIHWIQRKQQIWWVLLLVKTYIIPLYWPRLNTVQWFRLSLSQRHEISKLRLNPTGKSFCSVTKLPHTCLFIFLKSK